MAGETGSGSTSARRRSGVNRVFSLLTGEEERDLEISREAAEACAHGMKFLSYPISDRQVPDSERNLAKALEKLEGELADGRNVVLHCRQGIGRTGLVAACLLVTKGVDPATAVRRLSAARGVSVPETPEQLHWINHYAESVSTPR